MSDPALGKAVLELSTDSAKLNKGLNDAKNSAETLGGNFKRAGQDAKEFSGHLDALGHSFVLRVTESMLLHDAIREVLTVIKDLPADFLEMVSRGSKVQDVSDAFDRLTASAGGSAAVMAKLREGTKGTVGDFELMKVANTLLSDGVKLTADQFGLLASGARQLAKQTGVDTVEAFDMLAHAMETGKGKALNAIGVHVDLDATLARYSDTIGKNVVDLTAQEKTAAFTAEALRQLASNQRAVGDQALSAGEKIKAGRVYLENLEDEVDRGIANSPVLAAAMDGIGKAFGRAFGSDQQKQVETIVTLVGDVAIVAAKTGGFLLTLGNDIRDFFVTAGAGVQQLVLSYTEREQRDVEKLLASYEKVGTGQSAAVKARIADLKSRLDGLRAYNTTLTNEINGSLVSNDKVNKLVEQGQKDIAAMVAAMEKAQAAHGTTAAAASAHGTAVGDLGDHYVKLTTEQKAQRKAMEDILAAAIPLTAAQKAAAVANEALGVSASTTAKALGISAEAVAHYLESIKATQEIADTWEKFHTGLLQASNLFIAKWIDSTNKAARAVADGEAKELAAQLTAYTEYEEKNYQLTLRGTALQVEQLEVQRKAAIDKLGERFAGEGPIYDMALAQINKFYDQQVTAAEDSFTTIAKGLSALGQAFTQVGKEIGGLTGALVVGLGHVTDSFSQAAGAASAFNKAAKADDLLGMTTGILGVVDAGVQLGNMLATLTATAAHPGGLLGLKSGWLGDVLGTNNQGRSIVETFAALHGGFDALHAKMLATIPDAERLWKALTQLSNNADIGAANAAVKAVQDAIAAAPATLAANAGYQTKAELDAIAKKAKDVYDYMLASGQYTAAELAKAFEASAAATKAAAGDIAGAQAAALDDITAKYADTIAQIDSEYKSLSTSVAQEATEDVMGIVETQQRARMQELEDQKKALEAQRDAELASKTATFGDILDAGQQAHKDLQDIYTNNPLEISYKFVALDTPSFPSSPDGGYAMPPLVLSDPGAAFRAGGASSSFAGATSREHEQTIVVKLNDRELIRAVARGLPRDLVISGVGGR